ncbi:hypothetical protein GCM10010251_53420 [Streptomyces aurantiogriseus]|uniref:Uncharacterized protein n=1 Tax=Streptomyces aurantiogriseus TaxID=66870 RepID=A0A918CLY4_9ACTN|nr:hypothetical protein GCM10010251_53420 [Streptomyces aurantiogriseus]
MAAPITAVAARTAALRRTFMIGGCLSLSGSRAARDIPAARLRKPRRCRATARAAGAREPVTVPSGAVRLADPEGRFTVAGQRRICTGFPPYGCDDDPATLLARTKRPEGRL